MSRTSLVVGVDIGTTKVNVVVGEVDKQGVTILGSGSAPCHGLRKGVVNNVENTSAAIQQAVSDAESSAGCDIHSVMVGITGWQIKSLMSHGVVALRNGQVQPKDYSRVLEAAGAVVIPNDREVLHVLPSEYIVDGNARKKPLGVQGIRFEVNCHVITAVTTGINDLVDSCERAGLYVDGVVFEPLAGGLAVLTDTERENGVVYLDIGGGTTDLVLFHGGSVAHSAVIPLGGGHVTNDISQVLKVPLSPTAEQLKIEHGLALEEMAQHDLIELDIPELREIRTVNTRILAQIIENRMEEVFRLIRSEIETAGFDDLIASGVVLSGGGSLLASLDRLASRVFEAPARIGYPTGLGGNARLVNDPGFATGVGLIFYSMLESRIEGRVESPRRIDVESVVSKMKRWIANLI